MNIQMVDLIGQYNHIKEEIDTEIQKVLNNASFINGPKVTEFASNLATYSGVRNVIPCANGTDALQIALMALELEAGDEVIVPAFTYVASAEVIGLLGLTPVMVDVEESTFNIRAEDIEKAVTTKTKAVIPVHLFGQSCNMEEIMAVAQKYNLHVIEDNAQAIGAIYKFSDGSQKKTGTVGIIGCTSFFPSKNLGAYGDGGAMMTDNDELAEKLRMIANHGQKKKYIHTVLGCNSRLDTLQAAILDVKLKYLDSYSKARYEAAQYYTEKLASVTDIVTPSETSYSTHVYHQYTIRISPEKRELLKQHLSEDGIPSMIYYPLPLQEQEAFKSITRKAGSLDVSESLAKTVLSLPIHTEITRQEQDFIINSIKRFFQLQ